MDTCEWMNVPVVQTLTVSGDEDAGSFSSWCSPDREAVTGDSSEQTAPQPRHSSHSSSSSPAPSSARVAAKRNREEDSAFDSESGRGQKHKHITFPERSEVVNGLATGGCFTRERQGSSSSEVWNIFEEVAWSATEIFTGWVRCRICMNMQRFHTQLTGTSHMRRHKCFTADHPEVVAKFSSKASKYKAFVYDSNLEERFIEIRDIMTQDPVGYVGCRNCGALIRSDNNAITEHFCKDMDVERKVQLSGNIVFRSKPARARNQCPLWDSFQEMIDPETSSILNWVRCTKCMRLVKVPDPKSIPSSLRRHASACEAEIAPNIDEGRYDSASSPILPKADSQTADSGTNGFSSKAVVAGSRLDLKEKYVQFCSSELVPIEAMASASFQRLAKALISLGGANKNTILPLPDTDLLRLQLSSQVHSMTAAIKSQVLSALSRNLGAALICDSKDESCVISVQFVNSDWKLITNVLAASSQDTDTPDFISRTLATFDLDNEEKINKFIFISNGGVFDGVGIQMQSSAHLIDQVIVSCVFSDETVKQLVADCRIICVEHKLLDSELDVAWFGMFSVLNEVHKNEAKLDLVNINMHLANFLVDVLTPFREASSELRNTLSRPTCSIVVLWYYKLLKMLNAKQAEDEMGILLRLKSSIQQKLNLHSIHKIATFLWPNFRLLKMMTESDRKEVHQEVRTLLMTRMSQDGDTETEPAKKAHTDFSDWEDVAEEDSDEVGNYIAAVLPSCAEDTILNWWQEHQSDFPKLARLAKFILAVPASVTSLEKFKLTSGQNVDSQLLFLHCNQS